MKCISVILLGFSVMLSGCETIPQSVSCPPPPPAPQALTEPVYQGPSLMERYEAIEKKLLDSLKKAIKE